MLDVTLDSIRSGLDLKVEQYQAESIVLQGERGRLVGRHHHRVAPDRPQHLTEVLRSRFVIFNYQNLVSSCHDGYRCVRIVMRTIVPRPFSL